MDEKANGRRLFVRLDLSAKGGENVSVSASLLTALEIRLVSFGDGLQHEQGSRSRRNEA